MSDSACDSKETKSLSSEDSNHILPEVRRFYSYLTERMLKNGSPPSLESICKDLSIISSKAFDHLNTLEGLGAIYRRPETREIVAVYPFSGIRTKHRLKTPYGITYANCALDALCITHLFDIDYKIFTECHVCKRDITIGINNREIDYISHEGIMVWESFKTSSLPHILCV